MYYSWNRFPAYLSYWILLCNGMHHLQRRRHYCQHMYMPVDNLFPKSVTKATSKTMDDCVTLLSFFANGRYQQTPYSLVVLPHPYMAVWKEKEKNPDNHAEPLAYSAMLKNQNWVELRQLFATITPDTDPGFVAVRQTTMFRHHATCTCTAKACPEN